MSDLKKTGKVSTSQDKSFEYKSSLSYGDDPLAGSVYRPMMTSRNLIIQRTSYGGGNSGIGLYGSGGARAKNSYDMDRSMNFGAMQGMPAGGFTAVTNSGVTSVKISREKEKKDLQDLNERFASYIEKVRFLEAQNRKLADELEKLKSSWGKETTTVKAMYQAELDEARKLLDDNEKEKARLEIRAASLEEQMEELRIRVDETARSAQEQREKVERQNQQIADYEAEINLLRRRLESLETDREKDRKQNTALTESLTRVRTDLDNETLMHVDAENRRQTLEEQIEFMKSIHEQEMKELAALVYRDTTSENREFWKNEMGQALREIQQIYDDKMENMRGEMETFYNSKVQEFRTGASRQTIETVHSKEETKRLKSQLSEFYEKIANLEARNGQLSREMEALRREKDDRERQLESENGELKAEVARLRAEMESIMIELQHIMDTKMGLELEIAAYRKLLESEENRFTYSVMGGFSDVSSIGGYSSRVEGGGGGSGGGGGGSGGGGGGSGGGSGGSGGGGSGDGSGHGGGGGIGGGSGRSGGGGGGGSSADGGAGGRISSSSGGGMHRASESKISSKSETVTFSSAGNVEDSLSSAATKGDISAKTNFHRSAKGPVTISECGADGKFVTLENTGRKEESIGGWQIKRTVDDVDLSQYSLPEGLVLMNGDKLKVWVKGSKPSGAAASDLEATDLDNWGVGSNVTTKLINPAGEELATHTQKTVYG